MSWARGDVQDGGLAEFGDNGDCSTGIGYTWSAQGATGGRVGCAILDDGTVVVTWTDEDYLIEGFVSAPGTAQADLAALFDWRDRNAYFQD